MEVIIQIWDFSVENSSCYEANITELWNIDHTHDLNIFWGQSLVYMEVIIYVSLNYEI